MNTRFISILLVIAVFSAYPVFADEYHYNNILIGDRASGMGGAYTGVSDDPSGLYYNPAGIVYSSGRNLSASVNAYYNLTKTYDKAIGGYDWQRKSSALLPNFFGVIQPVSDKARIGFSYAVPDSSLEDQDQTFRNVPASLGNATYISEFVINFNNDDNTYNYGPTVAVELSDNLSTGLTFFVHQRKAQVINNQLVRLSDGRFEWSNIYAETNEWGVKPVFGIMWAPFKKVSLGLSASKTIVVSSDTERQVTFKGIDYSKDQVDRVISSTEEKRKYPYEVRFGFGYFHSESFLLSGDLAYYSKVKDPAFGDKTWVVNGALGAEYYLDRNWAVRAGVFSNMANTYKIEEGEKNQPEHINLYGGSLSLSRFSRNTSITLGGSLSYGKGEAQVIRESIAIQDVNTIAWTLFLSSSYSY